MGEQIVIFAGTIEGREMAEFCSREQIPAHVCVATEYGQELVEGLAGITVHRGRMDREEMQGFLQQLSPALVVDATHPYADLVTENIRQACEQLDLSCVRLLRAETDLQTAGHCLQFPTAAAAADWLEGREGRIFLTTGLKELPVFAARISDRSRLFARVLLQEAVFETMQQWGLSRQQIICMQGPFSRELNRGMLLQTGAAFLVTKESGKAGGFEEKLAAAAELGITTLVIRRPTREQGLCPEEVKELLRAFGPNESGQVRVSAQTRTPMQKEKISAAPAPAGQAPDGDVGTDRRRITLLGIGMGAPSSLTEEAAAACRKADCIIGASRMLETLATFGKPMVSMYAAGEIAAYIDSHREYKSFVIGLSGDPGFYSGSKKLLQAAADLPEKFEIRTVCGISSLLYLAAKLQLSWEDMALVSVHGRQQNVVAAVRKHEKTFCLVSDAKSVRELAELLCRFGLKDVILHVGVDLSYPTERICTGTAEEIRSFAGQGICAVVIRNPHEDRTVSCGIPDEAFLRDKVPMTKEEVRSIVLSKLQLKKDAIVYDVGAGSGSVSVECARLADEGRVYAIERKEEAAELIRKNRLRFGVPNLTVVTGTAPEACRDLPAPTHAFIGGSSGNMREIIALLREKNPEVRIVITCIALETVAECARLLQELAPGQQEVCCVNVAKARQLGSYHLMTGQNPVYVISMKF